MHEESEAVIKTMSILSSLGILAPPVLNRPGFTGDCSVLLKRLYLARSGLHSMPALAQLV